MGLEFLREHGASRVRSYPDQPALDGGDPDDEDDATIEEVDHDYEIPREAWKPIDIGDAEGGGEYLPRRFVDGCHVGHTIAWLQDAEGHPVPLMLAEIGGVCMTRDGRDLRRSFEVVERVVAMVIDPFPWHEIESFAAKLAASGFRLLPVSPPEGATEVDRRPAYDFEVMRKATQNRSNYEMEVLEEVALCQDATVTTVVDGRLEPRINSDAKLQLMPIVGVIKQQRKGYLHPRGWRVYYYLEPGQRTPAFLIRHGPEKKVTVPVVSWYLKLDGAHGAMPNWGVVRVEVARKFFEATGGDFGLLDRLSQSLFRMRCRRGDYARGPVSLEPIVRAEEALKCLFSPPSWLSHHFYRITGI